MVNDLPAQIEPELTATVGIAFTVTVITPKVAEQIAGLVEVTV
jgi:hypothetical protein